MESKEVDLFWHNYKFFPYEKKLALREVVSLLTPKEIEEKGNKITLKGLKNYKLTKQLVYFSHAKTEDLLCETLQFQYENTLKINDKVRAKRQNTRYSVHGLHEYKGKFNPQIVRSLFNIFGIKPGDKVLDPFCGSGTSLVESTHSGIEAIGTDINPLAAMIANTKIESLNIPWIEILKQKEQFFKYFNQEKTNLQLDQSNPRISYLMQWFPENVLIEMEALKIAASFCTNPISSIFLIVISNLLRDYSLQEPTDLRIRRRKSPLPEKPFLEAIETAIEFFVHNLKTFQVDFGIINSQNKAVNIDIRNFEDQVSDKGESFDFAITSPPYATALPYIDTQRLSLVWLDLIEAKQIKALESELIGSREFKIKQEQEEWMENMKSNKFRLPETITSFCNELNSKLLAEEGFRKKAVPPLLYRYFYDMQAAFQSVYRQLKKDKFFALIVGHNHTMIGGKRTEINTPEFLTVLGTNIGFKIHEITKLEAYQRYGLNAPNAVQSESLIVFKK